MLKMQEQNKEKGTLNQNQLTYTTQNGETVFPECKKHSEDPPLEDWILL